MMSDQSGCTDGADLRRYQLYVWPVTFQSPSIPLVIVNNNGCFSTSRYPSEPFARNGWSKAKPGREKDWLFYIRARLLLLEGLCWSEGVTGLSAKSANKLDSRGAVCVQADSTKLEHCRSSRR